MDRSSSQMCTASWSWHFNIREKIAFHSKLCLTCVVFHRIFQNFPRGEFSQLEGCTVFVPRVHIYSYIPRRNLSPTYRYILSSFYLVWPYAMSFNRAVPLFSCLSEVGDNETWNGISADEEVHGGACSVFRNSLCALHSLKICLFFSFFLNFTNSWTRRTKNEIKLQWLYFNNAQIRAVCWSSLNNSDSQGHTWVCYHTTSIAASSRSLAAIFNISSYEHGSLHTIVTGSIKIYSSHHYCDRYVEAKQS